MARSKSYADVGKKVDTTTSITPRGAAAATRTSSASRRGGRRNTSPHPPGGQTTRSTPEPMGSPVRKAVSTAQKRVRQRSTQFHGR